MELSLFQPFLIAWWVYIVQNTNRKMNILLNPFFHNRNVYGQYTDKYLLDKGEVNPDKVDLTPDGTVVKPNEKSRQNRTFIQLRYVYNGKMIDYKKVDGLKSIKKTCPSLPPKPQVTCPPAVTQKPVTCPPVTQCPGMYTFLFFCLFFLSNIWEWGIYVNFLISYMINKGRGIGSEKVQ